MSRKDFIDEKTGLYIPSMKEMGINDTDIMQNSNEWYDEQIKKWQAKDAIKSSKKARLKMMNDESRIMLHWFNRLPKNEITALIDESRARSGILDNACLSKNPEGIKEHYRTLSRKVKHLNFTVEPLISEKVLQFPKLNSRDNTLFGSNTSFIRLWTYVFSSRRG